MSTTSGPTPADPAREELTARRVAGRYRLLQVIGSGGMGTVWRAYDELLSREVAVKELRQPPGTSESDATTLAERTLREARAAGRLANPHVVTVYDVVVDDDRPWIVMELLRARSLAAVIAEEGPLPPDRVARIGLQVLSALEDAHRHDMLHRDVKPGNVMLGSGDWVTLTDFGLVTVTGDPHLTAAGVVLGSPSYLAPERTRASAEPGPASDLWSLGATLYTAAEGQPPFERDSAIETVSAVLNDKPTAMRRAGPLKGALSGLLRKDPERRVDSAEARAQLERAASATRSRTSDQLPPARAAPLPAPPPRAPESSAPDPQPVQIPAPRAEPRKGPGPRPRWRILAAVGATVAVIAVAVGFVATRGSDSTTGASDSAPGSEAAPSPVVPEAPEAYRITTHPTGYTLAVPVGWQQSGPAERTDYTDPTGTAALRVAFAQTDGQGALATQQQAHTLAEAGSPGYQLISLDPVDYRGWDAAQWEWTDTSDNGQRHVRTRTFIVPGAPDQYSVTLETPAQAWQSLEPVFAAAVETFQPPRP